MRLKPSDTRVTDAWPRPVWDILNQELTMRNVINFNSTLIYPSNWTTMSLNEIPVQFISLSHSSQEYQDISTFFSTSRILFNMVANGCRRSRATANSLDPFQADTTRKEHLANKR